MKMLKHIQYGLFILLMLVTGSACSIKVPMDPHVGRLEISARKLPVEAALLIPDKTKDYVYKGYPNSFTGGARQHHFPLGSALKKASIQAFSQIFEKLMVVGDLEKAKQFPIYLVPEIEDFYFEYDQLSYAGFGVAVITKVAVKGTLKDGETIVWQRSVQTPEQKEGPWAINFDFDVSAGRSACHSIEYALKEIAIGIITSSHVQDYIAGRHRRAGSSASGQPNNSGKLRLSGTGTGFIIGREGYIITNYHVVRGAREVRSPNIKGLLKLISVDKQNDLALLKADLNINSGINLMSSKNRLRTGEEIVVVGFPLQQLLSHEPHVTKGNISALAGPMDDKRFIQISAPIQSGNSGSPVFNDNGDVVGVVVAKLDEIQVLKNAGTFPQNVNFAIHIAIVKAFLETNGVNYTTVTSSGQKKTADLVEQVKKSVIYLENWR